MRSQRLGHNRVTFTHSLYTPRVSCGSEGKDPAQGIHPWVRKIPWERKWQPTPVFLPEKPQGQRSLAATVQYRTWQRERTERLTHTCAPTLQPAPLDTLPQTLGGTASLCLLWLPRASSALVQVGIQVRPRAQTRRLRSECPLSPSPGRPGLLQKHWLLASAPRSHPRTCTCALAARGCHRAGPSPGLPGRPPPAPLAAPRPLPASGGGGASGARLLSSPSAFTPLSPPDVGERKQKT